ncbi:hypothetical protein ACETU7_28525 [Rhodococcus sp. 3Y1]
MIDDFADPSVVKDVLKPAAEPTPLETHLKILAETERSRSDRLVYEGDAAPPRSAISRSGSRNATETRRSSTT